MKTVICKKCGASHVCTKLTNKERAQRAIAARWVKRGSGGENKSGTEKNLGRGGAKKAAAVRSDGCMESGEDGSQNEA